MKSNLPFFLSWLVFSVPHLRNDCLPKEFNFSNRCRAIKILLFLFMSASVSWSAILCVCCCSSLQEKKCVPCDHYEGGLWKLVPGFLLTLPDASFSFTDSALHAFSVIKHCECNCLNPVSSSSESSNVCVPWGIWNKLTWSLNLLIGSFLFIFGFQQPMINLGVFFFEFILLRVSWVSCISKSSLTERAHITLGVS